MKSSREIHYLYECFTCEPLTVIHTRLRSLLWERMRCPKIQVFSRNSELEQKGRKELLARSQLSSSSIEFHCHCFYSCCFSCIAFDSSIANSFSAILILSFSCASFCFTFGCKEWSDFTPNCHLQMNFWRKFDKAWKPASQPPSFISWRYTFLVPSGLSFYALHL